MLKKIKKFVMEETSKTLIRTLLALAVSSLVAYLSWGSISVFLAGSHSLSNALGLLIYPLAAAGAFFIVRALLPRMPDYFKYDKDYLDGMLWTWNWSLGPAGEASMELNGPKCSHCMLELEPVITDDGELFYYCQDNYCGRVYKSGFGDESAHRQFIERKITQYISTGKYRERMKKKYPPAR